MKNASIVLLFCLLGFLSFTANAQTGCTYVVLAPQETLFFTANGGSVRTGTIVAANYLLPVSQDGTSQSVEFINGSGRVISRDDKPVRGALVRFVNSATGEILITTTNQFGYFHLTVQRGQAYSIALSHKRYKFTGTRAVTYNSGALVAIFTADPEQ